MRPTFAPSDRIAALGAFVGEFWSAIFDANIAQSFVSNGSTLDSWEHYVQGGREEVIRRVLERYGVDIEPIYDQPIPEVLRRVRDGFA